MCYPTSGRNTKHPLKKWKNTIGGNTLRVSLDILKERIILLIQTYLLAVE